MDATQQRVEYLDLDIRDASALRRVVSRFRPQTALHLAALKDASGSVSVPMEYMDVNVAGTLSLLRALEEVGCEGLVYSSSAAVCGEPPYLPLGEVHPRRPISPSRPTPANRWASAFPARSAADRSGPP